MLNFFLLNFKKIKFNKLVEIEIGSNIDIISIKLKSYSSNIGVPITNTPTPAIDCNIIKKNINKYIRFASTISMVITYTLIQFQL